MNRLGHIVYLVLCLTIACAAATVRRAPRIIRRGLFIL